MSIFLLILIPTSYFLSYFFGKKSSYFIFIYHFSSVNFEPKYIDCYHLTHGAILLWTLEKMKINTNEFQFERQKRAWSMLGSETQLAELSLNIWKWSCFQLCFVSQNWTNLEFKETLILLQESVLLHWYILKICSQVKRFITKSWPTVYTI